MSSGDRKKTRRSYRPAVEGMEALRLFSGAAATLPGIAAQHEFLTDRIGDGVVARPAWATTLERSPASTLLAPTPSEASPEALRSGLAQLDRYLGRTWHRAGIAPHLHDDCSQAVYAILLENLGRAGFDRLAGDIGLTSIREVLSRETPEGPDFFRAIDTVKKRAQRQRDFQPLDASRTVTPEGHQGEQNDRRHALQEAIVAALSPLEAALIYATLRGETPAEIAHRRGVAPKTVSNEKTRVLKKLREFLETELAD